ncbi:TonB-dependent Receptor Plug Domain [Ferrimonas sediminum]|uniref:TonB-dependent Receptor Plug Domain n=1 Tax=Ferrimonas sediminum TaxID=718193 RepID=A0A1G8LF92_9GAMM|nr:TonB-dependent receptor [Ferrimonas sediminum]SDI54331.1 TonB-dependent Receptor Plug Domain [Ferrimonas sediminum]
MKNSLLSTTIRFSMIAGATTAALAAPVVYAEEEVERIEVTGSRIKRTDVETPVPVTVISRSDMDAIGALNVADVLNSSPVAIAGSDQSNSSFSTTTVGLATTELRNLGAERTLVLVNGRRFVSGVDPSTGYAVDLNSIPTSIIERIEILKSASSAIYGSDAVAGVVNIITRNEVEGVEVNAQYGTSDESDRDTVELNITAGGSWNSGNAYVTMGWDDDEGLKASDRGFSAQDTAIYLDDNGNEFADVLFSSYPPQGRITIPDVGSFNADGTPFTADSRFNRADYRQLVTPIERRYAAAGLTQEINDDLRFFAELNYNGSETNDSTIEPTPLDVVNDIWLQDRNGTGGMDINSPLIPELMRQELINAGITNLNEVAFVRRLVEFGARSTDVERDTIRMAAGFDWIINDDWEAEFYYTWGKTDQWQNNGGQINIERAALALDVIDDGTGSLVCRDETARLQGCVPLDLFGAGTVTPEAVDYVRSPAKATGEVAQEVFGASVAGEMPLELPGGRIGAVLGYEYRDESGNYQPGDLAQTGSSSTNRSEPTDGSFHTNDIFGELQFPILDELILNLAARYSDHSIVGGQTTWNAGVEYSPIESLKLRASAATAVRTPNIADLFGGRGQTFASVSDPCSGLISEGTSGNVLDNCLSIDAIAQRVADDGDFVLTQTEAQGTGGFVGGNPDVQEETAETFSLGFIWQAMDNLSFTVDYYDISIDDAITTTTRTTVLRRCFEQDPSQFEETCGGNAIRNADGALIEVNSGTANENKIDTSGFDLELNYNQEMFGGDLRASLIYNYIREYVETGIESGDSIDLAGEVLKPENRAVANLSYGYDDFDISWRIRFWDEVVDSVEGANFNFTDFQPLDEFNSVASYVIHDLNLGYAVTDSVQTNLGIRNLFDKEPPLLPQGTVHGGTGINTASEAYDVTGRYFYVGLNMTF